MATRTPVEKKVSWATAAAYLSSTGILAILATVQDDARLLSWMPDALSPFALALVPTTITFAAGWRTRYTPPRAPAPEEG
ncbi:holin [Streptomyces sp. NBC_01260]|uniref:holin n=1 Tax=unclassified Streptomyces TaxID=2593676 RepID=UPI00288A1514|nr:MULTISPECIES: holin [unclassified Streptomyces]WNI31504.1 holin [Streptomyces sp. ITFR-6]